MMSRPTASVATGVPRLTCKQCAISVSPYRVCLPECTIPVAAAIPTAEWILPCKSTTARAASASLVRYTVLLMPDNDGQLFTMPLKIFPIA